MSTKYIVNNLSGQTINGNPIDPKYKVYTALLTQSGEDDPYAIDSGLLTIGVTYMINNPSVESDFTNVGAPNNLSGTYFVATGTTPNNWGTDTGILAYNTGAPVVTVLENTIGNIWFTYNDVGNYFLYSDNAFIIGKTWNTKCLDFGVNGGTLRALLSNNEDLNTMTVYTESDYDIVANDLLYNTSIEIRVYN